MKYLLILINLLIAILPSLIKIPIYRLFFRYQIGKNVKIGLTPFISIKVCQIGDNVRIGHLNIFYQIEAINIGDQTQIGFFNLFRGGQKISIGSYTTILRQNVFNSSIKSEAVNPTEPILELGTGVVVTSGHWLDFRDKITIGSHTIIGGRNSSFWTHTRQRTKGISIGYHCYLGSEIRVAPGVEIPSFCIVALGSVLMGKFDKNRCIIGGNPANIMRDLQEKDLFFIVRKNREDIPDEEVLSLLPEDIKTGFKK